MQRKYPNRPYKRNVLTKQQVDDRMKNGCPCCGGKLVLRPGAWTDEETGKKYKSGSFLGCVNYSKDYSKGCNAEYSLSFDRQRVESWYE